MLNIKNNAKHIQRSFLSLLSVFFLFLLHSPPYVRVIAVIVIAVIVILATIDHKDDAPLELGRVLAPLEIVCVHFPTTTLNRLPLLLL